MKNWLEQFRHRLGSVDAVPQLALVGVVTGILTAMVIIVFRFIIETTQQGLLPTGEAENYEDLSWEVRLLLPIIGALAISFVWWMVSPRSRNVGVVHVLERLAYNQAYLPLKNVLLQFFGATIGIISGHSIGREGPSIHLGAASGSLLGQLLQLPNNTLRTLVACGTAAAIAASFNTPLAGVIFAMEVIVLEYTMTGFTPVILAAVSATVLTRTVFGDSPAFEVPPLELSGLWEIPIILLLGLLLGALAAAFNKIMKSCAKLSMHISVWIKFFVAGLLTGVVAIFVPQIMGIGYDTLNSALLGNIAIGTLVLILFAKLMVTSVVVGLGIPGGLIGPSLLMGAVTGAALGLIAASIFPGSVASPGFYAMLGMGAMMAAVLQAPLAALMAMLELTVNTHIILPGMLTVIIASMTSRHVFGCDGAFTMLLKARGLDYAHHPVVQSLRRAAVSSVMTTSLVRLSAVIKVEYIQKQLVSQPQWVVIQGNPDDEPILLRSADLALALKSANEPELSLLDIPAEHLGCVCINSHATLQQAYDRMLAADTEMLCVVRHYNRNQEEDKPISGRVVGVLSKDMISSYYQYP